ncbi:D-alanyl-D-alanine carboxypeptidase family protein [Streptomyces sp. NRRL WC-3725]|uniref:D-alanyl-D-alanine carboxypeptidase family protein n=1 Tax=Streptomyces sp. NRRL WC-3725 TaxID=1463933 RepID=UPI00068AE73A|nr:serine hydrolase [Streptomyces sp. NRRL WC-3725]
MLLYSPPGRRPRHAPPWIALISLPALTALAVTVAAAAVGVGRPGSTDGHSAAPDRRVATLAAELPWPADGQSSVEVEGLGSLGTRGEQTPVPIASLTKVMTAYVILRDHPLHGTQQGPEITVDRQAADESVSGTESTAPVQAGQRFSQRRLLELLLLPSANNIARMLARWDAGSQEAFTEKMNRAASGLGMDRTTYTGASGIETTTVSTSRDQLRLAREAMKNSVFRKIVATRSTTMPGIPGAVTNTNTLLRIPGVVGLKTGSSTPAGGNLAWAATADSDGRERLVLGVVLHQRANTSPEQGLQAALERSERLITAVRAALASGRGASA